VESLYCEANKLTRHLFSVFYCSQKVLRSFFAELASSSFQGNLYVSFLRAPAAKLTLNDLSRKSTAISSTPQTNSTTITQQSAPPPVAPQSNQMPPILLPQTSSSDVTPAAPSSPNSSLNDVFVTLESVRPSEFMSSNELKSDLVFDDGHWTFSFLTILSPRRSWHLWNFRTHPQAGCLSLNDLF